MHPVIILQLLILLTLANGTPLVAKKLFGERYSHPLDGNVTFADGRPLFGPSKTIRGIVLAGLATTAAASVIGLRRETGLLVGLCNGGRPLLQFLQTPVGHADEQPGERPRPDSGSVVAVARVPRAAGLDGRRHCGVRRYVRRRGGGAVAPALCLPPTGSPLLRRAAVARQPMQRDFRRAVQPHR